MKHPFVRILLNLVFASYKIMFIDHHRCGTNTSIFQVFQRAVEAKVDEYLDDRIDRRDAPVAERGYIIQIIQNID